MMIRVLVGPALPVGDGHPTEQPVRWLERVGLGHGQTLQALHRSGAIMRESGRLGTPGPWVEHWARRAAVRPRDGSPQTKELQHEALATRYGLGPWADTKNHRGGVAKMAKHLVRSERASAPLTIGLQGIEPSDQGAQNPGVGHSPHGRMLHVAGPPPLHLILRLRPLTVARLPPADLLKSPGNPGRRSRCPGSAPVRHRSTSAP